MTMFVESTHSAVLTTECTFIACSVVIEIQWLPSRYMTLKSG